MLRRRSSEVMGRRPPYALHVGLGLGVFQAIGYPPNWLFSPRTTTWRRCRRLAKIALRTWRIGLTDVECKYGAKKLRKLRGGGCIFNSELARTFLGIRATRETEGVCLLCSVQYAFWYRPRRKTRCEASAILIAKPNLPMAVGY